MHSSAESRGTSTSFNQKHKNRVCLLVFLTDEVLKMSQGVITGNEKRKSFA